jgi:hypothetical protein
VADAVNESASLAQRAAPPSEPLARPRPDPDVSRRRFGAAYLLLAAVLGATVGLSVVFASNGGGRDSKAWSDWQPTQSGVARLNEIAKHVAGQYALPGGNQIVGVYSTPPVVQLQGQLAQARAISVGTGLRGERLQDSQILDAANAWAYELCGFGKNCTISDTAAEGKGSVARGRLLQREALELSLYTFKYEKAIDYVVTYFPPVPGSTAPAAVFVKRSDVKPALDRPLTQTLGPSKRVVAGKLHRRDLRAIDRYIQRAFTYSSTTLQDGSPLLVLSPITG